MRKWLYEGEDAETRVTQSGFGARRDATRSVTSHTAHFHNERLTRVVKISPGQGFHRFIVYLHHYPETSPTSKLCARADLSYRQSQRGKAQDGRLLQIPTESEGASCAGVIAFDHAIPLALHLTFLLYEAAHHLY